MHPLVVGVFSYEKKVPHDVSRKIIFHEVLMLEALLSQLGMARIQ